MRGFSYLWVLLLTLTLFTILGGLANINSRELQRIALDREQLQAQAYAESGIVYYQKIKPDLPFIQGLSNGRFEITAKQGIIYATGYCRRAKQTIQLKGKQQTLWYEN